jgi:hypothetical protein
LDALQVYFLSITIWLYSNIQSKWLRKNWRDCMQFESTGDEVVSESFKSWHDMMKISWSVVLWLFGWHDPRLLREEAQSGKESCKRMGMRLGWPSILNLAVNYMQFMQMHWKILNWARNVRICYLPKYSKYVAGLLINMFHFYIHRSLPCNAPWLHWCRVANELHCPKVSSTKILFLNGLTI